MGSYSQRNDNGLKMPTAEAANNLIDSISDLRILARVAIVMIDPIVRIIMSRKVAHSLLAALILLYAGSILGQTITPTPSPTNTPTITPTALVVTEHGPGQSGRSDGRGISR